ncbi:MAG: sulfotransferase, partial [Rhodobacteraceae bacterium]|nr:sulfotransferase [Paracoccaceae bacterium]
MGATKAGTSWLYEHLSAHPDCHFRTIKELHYFQLTAPGQFGAALRRLQGEIDGLKARLTGAAAAQRARIERRLADLRDWRRVLQRRETDLDAYRAFLTEGQGERRLVGDITPAYALLDADRLALLPQVAADTRVVYLMRDPVARLWSHVRMIAQRVAPAGFA